MKRQMEGWKGGRTDRPHFIGAFRLLPGSNKSLLYKCFADRKLGINLKLKKTPKQLSVTLSILMVLYMS